MIHQKVISFPSSGVEFLERAPPQDSDLYEIHLSLVDLIKGLIPTETDVKIRQNIVDTTRDRIKENLRHIDSKFIVLPCGSCMNGTFLPHSDIDIAVFSYPSPCNPQEIMDSLIRGLGDIVVENSFIPLPQASVPVLKFSVRPGIPVDLSFDELHGPLSVAPTRTIFELVPEILAAQLFFKSVLRLHQLDQPYSGGISSYSLQLMLTAYVQIFGKQDNITEFILGFCDYFGNKFNYVLTGIDVSNHGCLFSRFDEEYMTYEPPTTLCIKDPLNPRNKLGQNSFKIPEIKYVFSDIYTSIKSGKGQQIIESLSQQLIEIHHIHQVIGDYLEEMPNI